MLGALAPAPQLPRPSARARGQLPARRHQPCWKSRPRSRSPSAAPARAGNGGGGESEALDQKFSVPNEEGWETPRPRSPSTTTARAATATPTDPWSAKAPGGRQDSRPPGVRDRPRPRRIPPPSLPQARIASYASDGRPHLRLPADRPGSVFALAYPRPDANAQFGANPDAEKDARAALQGVTVGGAPVHLTGFDALSQEAGGNDGPGVLLEAVLGGAGALLVLAFVFASFLAVVPLLMAIASILTTFLLLLGLTQLTDVSPIVQFLIALIGLGVAIDYSLIVVALARGRLLDRVVDVRHQVAAPADHCNSRREVHRSDPEQLIAPVSLSWLSMTGFSMRRTA